MCVCDVSFVGKKKSLEMAREQMNNASVLVGKKQLRISDFQNDIKLGCLLLHQML